MSQATGLRSPWVPLALVIGVIAVSISAILVRLTEAPALTVAFWRITFAVALLAPVWLSRSRRQSLRNLDAAQRWRFAGAGFFLGIHFATWIASLYYTSVATSVLLVTTNPVWVGLLSPWIVGERPTAKAWLGILVAMAGAGIVAWDSSGGDWPQAALGNTLAIIGALSASAYLMLGRRVRPAMDIWGYAAGTAMGAWVVLAVAVAVQAPELFQLRTVDWLLILGMAVGPQILGHGSLSWALRYVRADVVAVALLAEPIGASILAFFVLAEAPGTLVLVGGPVLLIGIGIVALENRE